MDIAAPIPLKLVGVFSVRFRALHFTKCLGPLPAFSAHYQMLDFII
jgi:hypothetical protein